MSPTSLRHPAMLRGSFPTVSQLLRRSHSCKTSALSQCLLNVRVSTTGCQLRWILQCRGAPEAAASLGEALTLRSVIPAEPKMICKPPREPGSHIPACRHCGCGAGGEKGRRGHGQHLEAAGTRGHRESSYVSPFHLLHTPHAPLNLPGFQWKKPSQI